MFPYLALLAWMAVVWCVRLIRQSSDSATLRRIALGVVIALAGLMLVPRFEVVPGSSAEPEVSRTSSGTVLAMQFHRKLIDFVDIDCVRGPFDAAYLGQHELEIDGKSLRWPRDFRVLRADGSVRLLLNRPRRVSNATLLLDPRLRVRSCVKAQANRYFLVYQFD
jgi:hypothetical protein